MKKYVISFVSIILMVFVMVGCDGGGGKSSQTSNGNGASSSAQPIDLASLFPPVDEEKLAYDTPSDTILTSASEGKAEFTPVDVRVDVADNLVYGEYDANGKTIMMVDASAVADSDKGKPLFVEGIFYGMIEDVSEVSGSKKVVLTEAQEVTDVYKNFDLEFKNDGVVSAAVKRALQRAIDRHKIVGKYDAINSEPLKISLVSRPQARSANNMVNDLALRIEFPKGYKIPVHPRGLKCSFTEASCDFTVDFKAHRHMDLGFQYEEGFVTVDTAGSYIEIGVGSYLHAFYDYNVASDNVFQVTAAQSAYFKSKLSVKVSGNVAAIALEDGLKWEKDIELLKDFHIYIPNPYNVAVDMWVGISPHFVLGFEGKLSGAVTYTHEIERKGEIRFEYDSTKGTHKFYSNAGDHADRSTKDSLNVGVEAEGKFFLFPNLTFVPSLTFLKIKKHVSVVALQSGVNMDNTLAGKIGNGFVAENKEKYSSGINTEASLTTELYGLIRGKWMVKIGSVVLYEDDDGYVNILEFPKQKLFEWKIQLLNAPKIVVKKDPDDPNRKKVFFSSDDAALLGNLYFYYNIGDTPESTKDVPVLDIEHNAHLWRVGDAPLSVEGNKYIKVRALLHNKDVSQSVWSWGTSVSAQNLLLVSSIAAPKIEPEAHVFDDRMTITLTQSQGADIYYKIDNEAVQKYTGPFDISTSATITAYSEIAFNGERIRSDVVSKTYEKCAEDEKAENDTCVAKTCLDDDYGCPVCEEGQTLLYNDDGSGYCSGGDGSDTNTSSGTDSSSGNNGSDTVSSIDINNSMTRECPWTRDSTQESYYDDDTMGEWVVYGETSCLYVENDTLFKETVRLQDNSVIEKIFAPNGTLVQIDRYFLDFEDEYDTHGTKRYIGYLYAFFDDGKIKAELFFDAHERLTGMNRLWIADKNDQGEWEYKGKVTDWFNEDGVIEKEEYADITISWERTYDKEGRLVHQSDSKGVTADYDYENRLVTRCTPDDGCKTQDLPAEYSGLGLYMITEWWYYLL
jgi:hypothetical protein